MKHLAIVQQEKEDMMAMISRKVENNKIETDIISIPSLVLHIPYEYHDEDHRAGFSFIIDQKTFLPCAGSWYRANGLATCREVQLSPEELELTKAYFVRYFANLWSDFCKCTDGVIDKLVDGNI